MSNSGFKSLVCFLSVLIFAAGIYAQPLAKPLYGPAPFAAGEVLTYEGKLNRILRGIAVADLTFTVDDVPQTNDLLIKAEARSKGTLLKFFRFSFLQQLNSTIDGDTFSALQTVKHDIQKDRVRNSRAIFDYDEKRVTFVESDPNEPMRAPRKIASHLEGHAHDIISGIYALRMLPLEVGKTFELSVSDSGLVYDIPVRVTGMEEQRTVLGKVMCFRIEPEVFGRGRFIEQEGSMIIWVTADERRLPVRSQINSSLGRIEVKLRSATSK